MSRIAKGFDIAKDKVRVGLIEYSSQSDLVFDFNKYHTKAALTSAILNTTKTDGFTHTDKALDLAKNQLFTTASGMRSVLISLYLFV